MPPDKRHRIYPPLLSRARDFRHPLTPAEHKIWQRVRSGQLGYKIRRQQVIDRFIADFYCAGAKLVIEIDGDTHAEPDQAEYDSARTEWLEACGYHVIRFNNRDIHNNIESVLSAIQVACRSLSPVGSPLRFAARVQGRDEGVKRAFTLIPCTSPLREKGDTFAPSPHRRALSASLRGSRVGVRGDGKVRG